MQRFISDGKRTEELTAQVAQLRRELEEANAAAEKRTEELTAQVTQLRRELEATWALKRESPVTNVIVVTIDENPDCLFEALKAGAAGYVVKDATQEEVISAVRQVIGGESPLNSALSTSLRSSRAASRIRSAQEEAHPPKDLKRAQSPHLVLLRGLRGERSRSWDWWLRGTLTVRSRKNWCLAVEPSRSTYSA